MKKSVLLNLFLSVILLCISATAAFPQSKTPTIEEIISLKSPASVMTSSNSVQISPDGQYVLYVVSETDWEENEYKTQLWLANTSTGVSRQMSFNKKSSFNPTWSPDSQFISFVSAREKDPQIYIMSAHGGEARAITKSKTGINGYRWSPDGN